MRALIFLLLPLPSQILSDPLILNLIHLHRRLRSLVPFYSHCSACLNARCCTLLKSLKRFNVLPQGVRLNRFVEQNVVVGVIGEVLRLS